LRVYVQLKRYYDEKPTVNVYSATPATPGTLAAEDYTNIGSIPFATALLYDDVVEAGRNTFYLNAAGIASISVLDLINFGLRINFDVDNHEPPHYGSSVWEFGFLTSTSNVTAEKAELDLEYESSPLVRTYDAENVDIYSARLRGRLLLDGGLVCQGRFEYGKTLAFGKETSWQLVTEENPSINQGYFETDVTDLEPDTLYYFRAVAENPMGINYGYGSGAYKTFTTLPGPPLVTRIKGGNMPNRLVAARAI
jgi:hypothetical protein